MRRIAPAGRGPVSAKIGASSSVLLFGLALGFATLLALTLGSVATPLGDVARALVSPDVDLDPVLLDVRLPRIACGAAVGASLAVAGASIIMRSDSALYLVAAEPQ